MRIKLILVKLFLLLIGLKSIYCQDTLNYYQHHFFNNVIFADSITQNKCIVQDGKISNEIIKAAKLKSVRIDCDLVRFEETSFDSLADFKLIHFMRSAIFENVSFFGKSSFAYDIFEQPVSFSGCVFSDHISKEFNDMGYDLDVRGGTSFLKTHFKAPVDFEMIFFKNVLYFKQAKFDSAVSFVCSIFLKNVYFSDAVFSKRLEFTYAKFIDGADFSGMVLPDTLDFDVVTEITKELDLTSTRLSFNNKVCYINLSGSDIDKIRINYNQFKLFFKKIDTDNDITSVYQKLLNKFKSDGQDESYQRLDIEFQKYKYKKSGQRLKSWVQEWWWNYGYNKEKVFFNTITLLIFFYILNILIGLIWGYNFLLDNVYYLENIGEEVDRLKEKYNKNGLKLFIAWLPLVFIYTASLFFIINLTPKHLRYSHKWALIYILVIFMVGLACTAYIINFVLDK